MCALRHVLVKARKAKIHVLQLDRLLPSRVFLLFYFFNHELHAAMYITKQLRFLSAPYCGVYISKLSLMYLKRTF